MMQRILDFFWLDRFSAISSVCLILQQNQFWNTWIVNNNVININNRWNNFFSSKFKLNLIYLAPEYFDLNVPPLSPNEAIFCWQIYSLETNQSIQKHAYWSTVSDMQNLFTHPKIVERFLDDDSCLEIYARLVSYLQGLVKSIEITFIEFIVIKFIAL